MNTQPVSIALTDLHPHPRNPRIEPRAEVVEQLAAQMADGFDPSHALIVRPNASGFEIISGHHRVLAAGQAGLTEVPCWVRDLDDETAYMQLVLCNTQSELHPLEEGLHSLRSGKSQSQYARETGKTRENIKLRENSAKVYESGRCLPEWRKWWSNLAEIHAAPEWLWPAMAARMVEGDWTVATTRQQVASFKDAPEPPDWCDLAGVAAGLLAAQISLSDLGRFAGAPDHARVTDADLADGLLEALHTARPTRLSAIQAICNEWGNRQADRDRERRAAEAEAQRSREAAEQRIARLRANCSLDEWKDLSAAERQSLLAPARGAGGAFNAQDTSAIEWAQWSWNPITGCKHDCPYCYARDITQDPRFESAFPNGFAPTFRSNALNGPANTKVPKGAKSDTRHRNVFTCSMADLFGRWVPSEWIESVMSTVRDSPEWNFLFLTKFPQRLAEIEIPDNAWMGTTVDMQARVANAEKAFAKVGGKVKWLSVEPMIEPLRFDRLDLFDWVVIGGASPSSQTPAWRPPFAWIMDLVTQCRDAGCRVYMKTNLFGEPKDGRGAYAANARILELPFDAPIVPDAHQAPDAFKYLGK